MLKPATQNNSHIHHGRHACTHRHSLTHSLSHSHTHKHTHTHTHTHTHKHTHSYTKIYHHTLPFNFGRSQSHPRSVPIKEVSNGSGEKITAFVSLSSTNTVCSRTRPIKFFSTRGELSQLSFIQNSTHTNKKLNMATKSSYLHST